MMSENEKLFRLLRRTLEEKAREAVKAGADPSDYDLGFPVYRQEQAFSVGDIYRYKKSNQPFECLTAYDGKVQPDWDLSVSTLWKPYHGKDIDHAYPWARPAGAHDMYKTGEYMAYTDGKIYKCLSDTVYSPDEYAQAWEEVAI